MKSDRSAELQLCANPPLAALVCEIRNELIFGEALIQKLDERFELRHVAEKEKPSNSLRPIQLNELRNFAQFTSDGTFRPLKSAPTLAQGWIINLANEEALGTALNHLYPGALADWFAAKAPHPPITGYREFTERQTGMYRITTTLDDKAAGSAILTCCDKSNCLKRRLWSVTGLPPDQAGEKSIIPCLEPCAVMLEFARKTARINLEKNAATVKA